MLQLGFVITRQAVFNGFVSGLIYGMLALGIVLIYRSARVINFAVANMGLPGAVLVSLCSREYGWPVWLAMLTGLIVGVGFAVIVELVVIRRLFQSPRVIVLVATIGVAQLAAAIVFAYPSVTENATKYPSLIPKDFEDFAGTGLFVTGGSLAIVIVVPLMALGLTWFLNYTTVGMTVHASADNADVARLSGITPKRVSTLVWTIGGFISTLSMILLSADRGVSSRAFASIGPNTMVRALAAAVLAGMLSFGFAMFAGVAIGIMISIVGLNSDVAGLVDLILLAGIFVAVFAHTRRHSAEAAALAFIPKTRAIPERLRQFWWIRHLGQIGFVFALGGAVLLGLIVDRPSSLQLYAVVLAFAVCACSLTVITGWAGQLSLGQMAFAGLGALGAAALVRGATVTWGPLDLEFVPWPYLAAIFVMPLVTAALAALLGAGALRVKGLLLAIVTFAFALTARNYLYRLDVLSDGNSSSVPLFRGELHLPWVLWDTATSSLVWDPIVVDMDTNRASYFLTLGCLAVVVAVLARLRRSGPGRSIIAVRDNPDSAAAYTISETRTKLKAFALAGGIAGLGGALLGSTIRLIPFTEKHFLPGDSLKLVSMVVIGGLGTVFGPVLGALWVEGLPAVFIENELVPLFTSSIGLLVLLLYFPGGLAQVGIGLRDTAFAALERRLPADEAPAPTAPPASISRRSTGDSEGTGAALTATGIEVSFGGNKAVDRASISIGRGEVVGLIGTNGAGKSTMMNAIGGYLPSSGSVELFGRDVSSLAAAKRAQLGFGRTFQSARLFPELTVRETVLVALEGRGHSGFLSTALLSPWAAKAERVRHSEAGDLIDFLGLGRYADVHVGDLSTGTRRIVELAGLLALDARVLCLDEPTAGVAQRETEAFGPLMLRIREELDASMLIIEHDMPLIMAISDRVYCLEQGQVIAEGEPGAVRNDPLVVASYLGTDVRAIDRSDS